RGNTERAGIGSLPGQALALVHEPTTEPAMLPAVVGRLMDPHHGTEHLQLADRGAGRVNPKTRVRNEHIELRVFEAEEYLVSSRGLVVGPQQGQGFRTWLDPAESDFAAADAHTPQAARTKSFPCKEAEIPVLRPILDLRGTDLSLHALDPTPPRDGRLHAGDQVDGLLRRERREAAGLPQSVKGGPGQDERRIDLEKVRAVVRIVEQRAERVEVAV